MLCYVYVQQNAPLAVQSTLLPEYSSNSMDRVINVEGTPPHFPQRHYVSSPALAHSPKKLVNIRLVFHHHLAQLKARLCYHFLKGLRVVCLSKITNSYTCHSGSPRLTTLNLVKNLHVYKNCNFT